MIILQLQEILNSLTLYSHLHLTGRILWISKLIVLNVSSAAEQPTSVNQFSGSLVVERTIIIVIIIAVIFVITIIIVIVIVIIRFLRWNVLAWRRSNAQQFSVKNVQTGEFSRNGKTLPEAQQTQGIESITWVISAVSPQTITFSLEITFSDKTTFSQETIFSHETTFSHEITFSHKKTFFTRKLFLTR